MNSNEELIRELISGGYLKTPEIIQAFRKVDRRGFVPEELTRFCYQNRPLPIGFGQTISQPLTVAFMLELLAPKAGQKILDIGAGSGWQTALLAEIVGERGRVIAVERIPELVEMAKKNLVRCGLAGKGTVVLKHKDGTSGYRTYAPFDGIIAAASAPKIPVQWQVQLKKGGRIVAPVGESIVCLEKLASGDFRRRDFFGFAFVPLVKDKPGRLASRTEV